MKWYKGDLHAHTQFSDGRDTLQEVLDRVADFGLDFFALTEHRTLEHIRHYPKDLDLILIPAFEFGSDLGHANIFNITELLEVNVSTDEEVTKKSLVEAREKGAYIAINHPFNYEIPWKIDVDTCTYDWIEIWNGPWFNSNQPALEWWHAQLCSGKKIPVGGGSDNHGVSIYHTNGQPTTWVCAGERTMPSILEGLKAGHTILTCNPDGPFIDFRCGGAITGDTVKNAKSVSFKVEGLAPGDIVRVLSDKGAAYERTVAEEQSVEDELAVSDEKFFRIEVLRYYDEFITYWVAALSNPIYFE